MYHIVYQLFLLVNLLQIQCASKLFILCSLTVGFSQINKFGIYVSRASVYNHRRVLPNRAEHVQLIFSHQFSHFAAPNKSPNAVRAPVPHQTTINKSKSFFCTAAQQTASNLQIHMAKANSDRLHPNTINRIQFTSSFGPLMQFSSRAILSSANFRLFKRQL